MVGRTPEYLGKKIEAREIKLVVARRAVHAAGRRWSRRRSRPRRSTARRRSSRPARRASPSRSTPTCRRPTTTARRSPATPATSSPTPGNVGAHGITFADLLGGLTMLIARFVPILVVLAVAGVAGRASGSRPPASGTMRTDTPDVRRAARRRGRARRRAHVLPRPPARPDRAGPDHPALLMRNATSSPPSLAIVVFTVLLGLAYPLRRSPAISQVAFPGKADGSQIKRDGKVVGSTLIAPAARARQRQEGLDGNPSRADPRYFQPRPSQTTTTRPARSSPTAARTRSRARGLLPGPARRLPEARAAATTPG